MYRMMILIRKVFITLLNSDIMHTLRLYVIFSFEQLVTAENMAFLTQTDITESFIIYNGIF